MKSVKSWEGTDMRGCTRLLLSGEISVLKLTVFASV